MARSQSSSGDPIGHPPASPKSVSKCGDLLLCGAMAAPLRAGRGQGLPVQISLIGVLEGLSRAFMSGQVIFFSLACPMRMGRLFPVLHGNLL